MSLEKELTPEQAALVPVYAEKWKNIALSTKPIDFDLAKEAVKNAYQLINQEVPEIVYYPSLYTAFRNINLDTWYDSTPNMLEDRIIYSLIKEIDRKGYSLYESLPESTADNILLHQFEFNIHRELAELFPDEMKIFEDLHIYYLSQLHEINEISVIDFYIEILNYQCDLKKWQILKTLILECGWIFQLKNICIVCDRPTKITFDSNNRLHSEVSPAIEYSDGFKIYAYHCVTFPEKYGKIHLNKWQPEWLLTEENAELRRVLIEGIGYEKILSELAATQIDSWREYTLLKIDKNIDVEPIYLLEMTCPSTKRIHALRVPPNMRSARVAIKWCNWGIDPEEFDLQT